MFVIQSVFRDSLQTFAPGQARTADIRITNTVYYYGSLTDWATVPTEKHYLLGFLPLLPDMVNMPNSLWFYCL